jgi:hypothetical protein
LFHVSDGESSERGILLERFNTHGFGGSHDGEARVSRFNEFGVSFKFFTGSSINFLSDFFEFNGNVGGVAIQDGGISVLDLTGVVKNDNLSEESNSGSGRIFFGVRGNISSFNFFDGNIFNIETDIVSWNGFSELFVMHFNGFDISGFV